MLLLITDEQLCSHLHSVCYMAESLDINRARVGTPCNNKCPFGRTAPGLPAFPSKPKKGLRADESIYMGAHMKSG